MDVLQPLPRRGLSLGAIVGGLLVAGVVQILLMMLGAAIGLTALPLAAASEQATQIGYAAWLVGSLVLSVFLGALVAAAGARSPYRGDGLLHGLVLWAAVGLGGVFLVGLKADALLGGAIRIAGRTMVAASPSPAASQAIAERQVEAQGQLENAVDRVKHEVAQASVGLQAAGAAEDAKLGLAIGLWSFLAVEGLLLLVALAGGAMAARGERRWQRKRSVAVAPRRPPATVVPDDALPAT